MNDIEYRLRKVVVKHMFKPWDKWTKYCISEDLKKEFPDMVDSEIKYPGYPRAIFFKLVFPHGSKYYRVDANPPEGK